MRSNLNFKTTNEFNLSQPKISFSDQVSPRVASIERSSTLSSPLKQGKNDFSKFFQNQSKSETKRTMTSQSASVTANTSSQNPPLSSQFPRKPTQKRAQPNNFADLLNKIADPGSQNVYEQSLDSLAQVTSARLSPYRDSPGSKIHKFTIKQVSPRSILGIRSAQGSPKATANTPHGYTEQSREDNFDKTKTDDYDFIREEPYKYSKLDSKFEEIQDLKYKNEYLQRENLQLRQDMIDVDEFDEVLKKKTKMENFNEKRCDILKACVRKQKRYIDYMNKTIRTCKTFYKDIKHILEFLVEMDDKYIRSGLKIDKETLQALEPPSIQVDMADRGFVEVYKELRNTDNIKRFYENFNEAYRKLVKMEEANVEIEKLFTLVGEHAQTKPVNPVTLHLQPELKKKLKYKYMFKQFIKRYNAIFPIYTVFSEFELKDKNKFSDFVHHLTLMSDRIAKVFSRIKNFDMLSHTTYAYNPDISELVVKNQTEFRDYFDRKNPNKRIFLKSEEIFQTEKSLSHLLNNLIVFHNDLALKKEDISIEAVLGLQESLRQSIESLLLLGITTNCDFSMGDKVLVVTKKNPHGGQSDFLREGYIPEKEILFEIYNQEDDNLDKYQALKNNINNLLQEAMKDAEKARSDSLNVTLEKLKRQVENLQINYEEMGAVSRLKDVEMNYMREYSRIAFKDIEKLRNFAEEKLGLMDTTLKDIDVQLKDLDRSADDFLLGLKEVKGKNQFQKKFKKVYKEVSDVIQVVLSKQRNSMYSDVTMLEDTFKKELEKIRKEVLRSGEKIRDITIKLRKK